MATMVLTAVGTALGGPIGGAIGGLIGNAFDHAVLFRPKGRQGPRMADLQVQTSSYGTQVPRLFGTLRVAGTVIWATDLNESVTKTSGGKGRGSVTSYSYSASFAVALSARPIRAVRRIWADGKLLRGAAGDFKSEMSGFRLYPGGEDQAVDPLIASAQGADLTPAHRGVAYALFEDLALADFGNRIPSLTFEVEADGDVVGLGRIAADLSEGGVAGDIGLPGVEGFAAGGADVAEAIAPLVDAWGLALCEGEAGLRLRVAGRDAEAAIAAETAARGTKGRAITPREQSGGAADRTPVAVSLRHYDAARDYQSGVQRVVRPGPGRQEQGIDLPVVMAADDARALAAQRLGTGWTGRATMTLRCGWDALTLEPGMTAAVADAPGLWRIEEREWEAMAVRLTLRRVAGAGGSVPGGASPGAIVRPPDAPHGATTLRIVELPPLREAVAGAPLLVAAASGGAGWRSAALFLIDANGDATPIGRSAPRATMGQAVTTLADGSAMLVDRVGALSVSLLAADMMLAGADEPALAQGRNLCLVGRELIQFEAAAQTGPGLWRLTGLRRGLRGTEWAMAGHEAGEPFLLIEEERLVEPLTLAGLTGEAGGTVKVAALGLGDADAVEAAATIRGEALIPPTPVHLRAERADGGLAVRWVRRSRAGWRWTSGSDVPLAEESERYTVRVLDGDRLVRGTEVAEPGWTYDAATIAADGTAGTIVTIEVAQVGTRAAGRAARLTAAL
ncbi:MAG: phage tail protein [Pseudomonadota bacterium]|jgi:hypothetical protein|nr:phage tail protein [Pseudomonadota bacterium]